MLKLYEVKLAQVEIELILDSLETYSNENSVSDFKTLELITEIEIKLNELIYIE